MGRKTEAYVDTSALIAFADRSDGHHAFFRRLLIKVTPPLARRVVHVESYPEQTYLDGDAVPVGSGENIATRRKDFADESDLQQSMPWQAPCTQLAYD